MAAVEQAAVIVQGIALSPSRLEEYDFQGQDGNRVKGSYFVTDLVQVTEGGTFLVPVRSDRPLVERPDPSTPIAVHCLWEIRNGRPRFTAQHAPSTNGAKPASQRSA